MRLLALLLFVLLLCTGRPAFASDLGAAMTASATGWLLFGAIILALALIAWLCRVGSAYLTEKLHASRVTRLMDVLASQADGIAGLLLSHPPAPGATLDAVRDAAIAQSVAYVKVNLPDTLEQIGVTDGVIATRLANYIAANLRLTKLGGADVAAVVPVPAALPQG